VHDQATLRDGKLPVILDRTDINADEFAAATGWNIKPQGACKGEVCVPLGDGPFDARVAAAKLGMAVVGDDDAGLWAFGPETIGGRALTTAEAPDLELVDVMTGEPFRLASLRGQKVVVAVWAPY
jgi:hypothetical protein